MIAVRFELVVHLTQNHFPWHRTSCLFEESSIIIYLACGTIFLAKS